MYDPTRPPPIPGMMQTTSIPAQGGFPMPQGFPGGVPMPQIPNGYLGSAPPNAPRSLGGDTSGRMGVNPDGVRTIADAFRTWVQGRPEDPNSPEFLAWRDAMPDPREILTGGGSPAHAPAPAAPVPGIAVGEPNPAAPPAYSPPTQIAPVPGGFPSAAPRPAPAMPQGYSQYLPQQAQQMQQGFPQQAQNYMGQFAQGQNIQRTKPGAAANGGFFGTRKGR